MKDEGHEAGGEKEAFLSRWSRLKDGSRAASEQLPPQAQVVHDVQTAPPPLPPVEELTSESDYRGFLHPKVDENLRRAALRKLFSDPHFNVMDGLDVYIDDYSKSEPLPAALLVQLTQAQNILGWAREDTGGESKRDAAAHDALIPAEPQFTPAPEPREQLPPDAGSPAMTESPPLTSASPRPTD
jgi:hypothetical protein